MPDHVHMLVSIQQRMSVASFGSLSNSVDEEF